MKKILNNVFKWAVLVWIAYSLIFTSIITMEEGGIISAIGFRANNIENYWLYNIEHEELEEMCKYYQNAADKGLSNDNIDVSLYTEEELRKQLEINDLYNRYPSGFMMVLRDALMAEGMSNLHITSFVMGIAVGTAIYLMLDKEKKGLKVIISLYVIFVILMGFVEGIQSVSGENLSLLDRWIFPETYIVAITVVFILAIIVRVLRQKDLAKELNEKLKEKKEIKK